MPADLAASIIDQIADNGLTQKMAYHLMGEPLMYPSLGEVLAHAHRRQLRNRLVTNGFLLSRPSALAPLRHCDSLDVSLRSTNAEEFAHNKPGGDFDQYLAGVAAFLARRKEHGAFVTRLRVFKTPAARGLLKQLGVDDDLVEDAYANGAGDTVDGVSILFEDQLDWNGKSKRYPSKLFGSCSDFTEGFSVLVDGSVTTCCWDSDGKNSLGRVNVDTPLMSVLDGPAARAFRHAFDRHRVPTNFCSECLGRPSMAKSIAYQAASFFGLR